VVLFWSTLSTLLTFSMRHEHYSHIMLVPLIAMVLVFQHRRAMISPAGASWRAGLALIVAGVSLYLLGQRHTGSFSRNDQLSVAMFAVVIVWIGAFTLCYGAGALRRGLFPMLFLFLMVPIPDALLNQMIAWLLAGSAEVSYALLALSGVPFVRTGWVFSFAEFAVEIADECSGIRSSLALLVLSLLCGHLMLRSTWAKAVFVVVTLPILIVKNGIRIVTLSLLSLYIDRGFLTGSLHQQGGVVFFLIALMLLVPVLRLLQRLEGKQPRAAAPIDPQSFPTVSRVEARKG